MAAAACGSRCPAAADRSPTCCTTLRLLPGLLPGLLPAGSSPRPRSPAARCGSTSSPWRSSPAPRACWRRASRTPAPIDYALGLAGRPEPRICVLNTAGGDDPRWALSMYDRFAGHPARLSHLALFPMPNVADPEDLLLSQDVIFVGGGSVANMLAVWRVHRLDVILRKAWQAGIVLAGSSAGGICWFEGGTTDSFGRDLRAFTDGLGLLAGSYCPHYDSEPGRRPLYHRLIAAGTLSGGIACDDGAAAHYTEHARA